MRANDKITKTYDLPFHKVVLHYEPEKTPGNFEKELVSRYLGFLKQMHEMRRQIKPLTESYYKEQFVAEEQEKQIDSFIAIYGSIKRQLEAMMDRREIEITLFLELRERFYDTNRDYLQYHKEEVDAWRELINGNDKVYQKLYDWFYDEGSDKAYLHFADYGKELYKNWDKYALDLVQYDQNVDKMRGEWGKASKEFDDLMDLREKTVKMVTSVTKKVNEVNETAQLLQQHFNELDHSRKMFNN